MHHAIFILEDESLPKSMREERVCLGVMCVFCGEKQAPINVFPDDFVSWNNGTCIQHAFPYLNADQRELLISGICPTCFKSTFSTSKD